MTEQFAAGTRRKTFAFDKRIVGDGGAQCFAPTETLLHRMAGGGDSHGVERGSIHRTRPEMVEIGAPVLGDANHVGGPAAPGDVYEKDMAGFLGQKAETDDLPR